MWKTSRLFLDCNPLDNTLPDFQMVVRGSGSLDRLEMDQLALGQLHWSTVNYAPFQEQALWDGLIAVYEQVGNFFKFFLVNSHFKELPSGSSLSFRSIVSQQLLSWNLIQFTPFDCSCLCYINCSALCRAW
jgi:hypothetical protein